MKRLSMIALLLAAGCGSAPKKETPADAFAALDRPGPVVLIAGELEVSSWTLANEKGVLKYEVNLRNLRSGSQFARVHVRFFDAAMATEYEKLPLLSEESLGAGESRRLAGTVDFSGLPECDRIAKMGVAVSCRKP